MKLYFLFSLSPTVLVIDGETNSPFSYFTTSGGRSIAVNSNNWYIFVPVTGVGIKVLTPRGSRAVHQLVA